MNNIMLKNINSILSKLLPSEYRGYWKAWKGYKSEKELKRLFNKWLDENYYKVVSTYEKEFGKKLDEFLKTKNQKEIDDVVKKYYNFDDDVEYNIKVDALDTLKYTKKENNPILTISEYKNFANSENKF